MSRLIPLYRAPFQALVLAALASAVLMLAACTTESEPEAEIGLQNLDLLQEYAGTWSVTATTQGAHSRGTVLIDESGAIDFDAGVAYVPGDYEGIHDRLFVTDSYGGPRIQVEIKPVGGGAPPRFRIFVDTAAGNLVKVAYYPDALSDAGTVVEVVRVSVDEGG
jgi:hypothetical protein